MINPVLAALAQARLRSAPLFARWSEREGTSFYPAAPAIVARFVKEAAGYGIEQLWPALQDISKLHASAGLADPTLGDPVAIAMSRIAGIAPPRSWPNDRKDQFKTLPYDLQVFIAGHEARRDRALRRAQNEAAATRRKLSELERRNSQEGSPSHEGGSQRENS